MDHEALQTLINELEDELRHLTPNIPMTSAEAYLKRTTVGITLEWLAADLNTTTTEIRAWENGNTPVPQPAAWAITRHHSIATGITQAIADDAQNQQLHATIPHPGTTDLGMPAEWWITIISEATALLDYANTTITYGPHISWDITEPQDQ